MQEKNTKNTSDNEPREDRFGGIVPADNVEERSQDRRFDTGNNVFLRPGASGRKSGRRPWQTSVLFFLISLLLFYVGTMYLVAPAVIPGPLARQAGRFLGCRLSVGNVFLSPFTFRFRVEKPALGPQQEEGEKTWLHAAAVRGRLQLLPLLQGRVRVGELHIERPEVFLLRDESGRYDLPVTLSRLQETFEKKHLGFDPDIFSFQVDNGRFFFDDQLTGNKHRIERIFYTADGKGGFQLQAMVNGSPMTVSRAGATGSGSEYLLQLQLENVDLERYLAYLPMENFLPGSLSGRARGSLELSLPLPTSEPGNRLAVQGVLDLENLVFASRQGQMEVDIPTARFSFEQAFPAGRLLVHELVLREPAFVLSAETLSASLMGLDLWPATTLFRRLLIDQGRLAVQTEKQTFHFQELQVSIQEPSRSHTGSGSSPATFQLGARQAGDLHGELSVEGRLVSGNLNGHLRLRGVDLAHLPGAVQDLFGLTGEGGNGELDCEIVLQSSGDEKKQRLILRNNRLQLHDFQLQTRDRGGVSGKSLLCQSSVFPFGEHADGPLCDRLDLLQAEITLSAAGFARLGWESEARNLPPLFRDLEIKDSSLHFTRENQKKIASLERVLIQVHGFPGHVDNPGKIVLQAGVGENGQVRLSGNLVQGKARLQYGIHDVGLVDVPVLRSWFSLPVQTGRLHARGQLIMPEVKAVGTVMVGDFLAADESKGSLQWRKLTATGTIVHMVPSTLWVDEVVLTAPAITFKQGTDGFLFPFSSKPNPEVWGAGSVVVKKVAFEGGEFQSGRERILPGLYPNLTGLAGTVEGWPLDPVSFVISGKLEDGDLSIKGWTGEPGTHDYALEVEALSLAPVAEKFLQTYGLEAGDARLSWRQQTTSAHTGGAEYLRCVLKNLRPQPGSPLASTLAFLTDINEEVILSMEHDPDDGRSLPLLDNVMNTLDEIRLREQTLPGSILQDQQPFLELPDALPFQTGWDTSDDFFLLDDYGDLLRNRPHLRIVVEGSFSPIADGAVLREILQEEADARLEVENLRRQQERALWLRLRKQQTDSGMAPGIPAEPVGNENLPEEVQPLPRSLVEVDPELLENLAGKRAEQVRQYLITRQSIMPERIVSRESVRTGAAAVYLSLEPFYQIEKDGGLDDN